MAEATIRRMGLHGMRFTTIFLLAAICVFFLNTGPVSAEDLTTNSGKVYRNYRILEHSATGVKIAHSEGIEYILYSALPDEVVAPYSPDLKIGSRVFKKYSVTEITSGGFTIAHAEGSDLIPFEEIPPWLVRKHREEVEKVQSRLIGDAVERIPKYGNLDEAFDFFEENYAVLSDHPEIGKLKGALADFATVKLRQCKRFEDGLEIFKKTINVVSDHPKAETVKNAFADFAIEKIRQLMNRDADSGSGTAVK